MNTGALIFGEVGVGSAAACRDIWFGTEAYERYQLPNYMQEFIRIKTEPGYICAWGNFEYLYYALELLGSNAFMEVGSTLFASIDKLQKCRRLAGHSDAFKQVHFYGVEPSALLRQTAEILHTDAQLSHVNEPGLPAGQQKPTGRSYQSTSYAFDSTATLVDWIAALEFSQHGIWFSAAGAQESHDAFGNSVTLFDYRDFIARMDAAGCRVIVTSVQAVSHYHFSCAEVWMFCHRMTDSQIAELEKLGVASKFGSARKLNLETTAAAELSQLPESIRQPRRDVGVSSGNAWTSLRNQRFLDFTSTRTRDSFEEFLKTQSG